MDPREYDPAGEVYIVGDTFNRNDAGVRMEFRLSPRSRLAFDGGYNVVRWDKSHIAGAPLFVDYGEMKGSVAFERDISEVTTGFASFTYGNTVSDVPFRPQFDALGHFRRYQFELGARTQVSETSGMAFRVGYERDVFKYAPEVNDFSSLIAEMRFRRAFRLSAPRESGPSSSSADAASVARASASVAEIPARSRWAVNAFRTPRRDVS
jgi:hypothetical protein